MTPRMTSVFAAFTQKDFDIFQIPGLEPRMTQIKAHIRPKLEQIGTQLQPFLSELLRVPVHVHVAKHARRTVNPPDSTWVAWSANVRGYKAHPHFQVGLWSSHLFIWFALFPEAEKAKPVFAQNFSRHLDKLLAQIPENFLWSFDHTRPDAKSHSDLKKEDFLDLIRRLQTVKKSEVLCGIHLPKTETALQHPTELEQIIQQTFQQLAPLYRLAISD